MELKAHLSPPQSPKGCLVIVHENRGLDDHIRDVANRFAREGFAVAAPDYLSPIGGSVADVDTNIANIKDVSREQVTEISQYWLNSLTALTKNNNQSILGFCWGGGVEPLRDPNQRTKKSGHVLWDGSGSIFDYKHPYISTTSLRRE